MGLWNLPLLLFKAVIKKRHSVLDTESSAFAVENDPGNNKKGKFLNLVQDDIFIYFNNLFIGETFTEPYA